MMITKADLERVGVRRHAEGFDTLAECRARFAEIKAQLTATGDTGLCVFTLRPGEGVPAMSTARPKRATEDGRLGSSAKMSTARPNPNAKNPDEHVICVYTYDEADDADVQRIRSELRSLGITWKIPYKLDNVTLAGRYRVRGDRHMSSRYE